MDDSTTPNQMPGQIPGDAGMGRDHHQMTLETLKGMSDDDLRGLAVEAGVDGAQAMGRDQLLAKLMDEPGANEL
jgi:hypothetical protein